MDRDEYILGRHHFWTHFWCGLVFGVGVGAWMSFGAFDAGWERILSTSIIAFVVASSCGRWGDSAWRGLLDLLSSFWWW